MCNLLTQAQPPFLTGRTSTLPRIPDGIFEATRMALFKSVTSIMKKPPSCSLISAQGPSVMPGLPPLIRTVVAV